MCLELDSFSKKLTTETATPVVSAPMFRAQIGMVKKLKANVQKTRREYLSDWVGIGTIFLCVRKDKIEKVRLIEVCEAWFCSKTLFIG